MEIINQELTGKTHYYAIEAELADGTEVEATLTVMEDESGVPSYDLTIVDSDRPLTDEECEELENKATNNF